MIAKLIAFILSPFRTIAKVTMAEHTFLVSPVGSFGEVTRNFDEIDPVITSENCPFKPNQFLPKVVELVRCKSTEYLEMLKEIDELGFESVSANYLLGLGVQHPTVFSRYLHITTLDEGSIFFPKGRYGYAEFKNICAQSLFLKLGLGFPKRHPHQLFTVDVKAKWPVDNLWWFAVTKKQN